LPCIGLPCPRFARCTPAEVTTYEEIGCFKDTRADRALGYQYDSSTMSAEVSHPAAVCVLDFLK